MREISPIDLTELMKSTLKANEKQLKKHIDFGNMNLDFGSELNFINMNNTKLENGDDFLKKKSIVFN